MKFWIIGYWITGDESSPMLKVGPTQQKILLLLAGTVVLGLTHDPRRYYRNLKALHSAWEEIDQRSFNRSIRSLCERKLLEETRLVNGNVKLTLTPEGKRFIRYSNLFGNSICIKRPKRWDGKWRLVIFDIPEKKRFFRDILRDHLTAIGFKKLQQSVFIYPYPCEREILQLTELYHATPYVRVSTLTYIDNELSLKSRFFGR